ncbi:MAG TPA: SpoIIE family protein phosphatase [Desulfobacterales bacterium]|jgi:sigma-B regulation protein RsbU (phosphoserine phosphatase)|nr:SpoIIE family protein phosphatase [Desulfobacterales bacterium]
MTTESVLLVDDNPTNLQMLFQLLEKSVGCKLLVAKNGETALTIARKTQPDLILLDIMMPGIDGFEVCRRLKADPATAPIPVIFLSALDETADKVKGLQLGAVDYVSKPFQAEEVTARVNTHLTIHRLSREVQEQRDQLEHELTVVSELQRRLLPERLPAVVGLRLAEHYETSRYAGGDYYDAVELPDGRCGLLVADSEGHSAPATVMMAMTCALFRSCPELHDRPDKVLDFINTNLCKVNKESFVTAIYAVYDSKHRSLRVARAGHPLPILFRPAEGNAREVPCDGVFMMGFDPYDQIPVTDIRLEPGDRLLLYTDGVSERFSRDEQPYGEERLRRQMGKSGADGPAAVIAGIMQDLEAFAGGRPADDDQTLVMAFIE